MGHTPILGDSQHSDNGLLGTGGHTVTALGKQVRVLAKNVKAIEAVRPGPRQVNYRIRGEKGLVLVVHPTGRKTWFVRYQVGRGKTRLQRWHEIGDLADSKSLAQACAEATHIMSRVADGEDPSKPELTTFGALFDAWLEQHAKKKLDTWEDEKRRYEMYLNGPRAIGVETEGVAPYRIKRELALGPRAFSEIERKDVGAVRDEVLEICWAIEATRVVARFFQQGCQLGRRRGPRRFQSSRSTAQAGEGAAARAYNDAHRAWPPWEEFGREIVVDHWAGGINEFDLPAAIAIRRALKVLCLTGQRRSEVIEMEKAELDLDCDKPVWTIRNISARKMAYLIECH